MVGLSDIEARNTKTGRNNLSKLWGKFPFKVDGGVAERVFKDAHNKNFFRHDFKIEGGC